MIRVLVADDHAVVRHGLKQLLATFPDVELVGEAANGEEAAALCAERKPDVVLMDLEMPVADGIEATKRIRALDADVAVVVLTSFSDRARILQALDAGAVGYLLKDVVKTELMMAIQAAKEGKPWLHREVQRHLVARAQRPREAGPFESLTPRELSVLTCIARGRSNKEIGHDLNLSEGTVKGYVSAVLAKLGVDDRTQAALLAAKHGLGST